MGRKANEKNRYRRKYYGSKEDNKWFAVDGTAGRSDYQGFLAGHGFAACGWERMGKMLLSLAPDVFLAGVFGFAAVICHAARGCVSSLLSPCHCAGRYV